MSSTRKKINILFLVFFIIVSTGVSQMLLETDFGARPVAMGGAYVSILGGPESIFWNPAGMSEPKKADVTIGYQYKFGGLSHIQFFGDYNLDLPTLPLLNGYVGFGVVNWWTRMEGWNSINENIGYVGASETLIGLAYKRSFFNLLSAGLTLKYSGSYIDKDGAGAFVMDFGARSEISGIGIGFLIKNIGIGSAKLNIPMGIVVGGNYTVYKTFNNMHKVNVAAQLSSVQDVGFILNVGAEYAFQNFLFARIGHNGIPELSLGLLSGMRFGFGAKKYGGQFDYVFSSFADLGPVHDVSFSYRLDPFFGFQEDVLPPEVQVKPLGIFYHKYFFSPDNDFVNESLESEVLLKDRSGIQEWGYIIQDDKGNPISKKLHLPVQDQKILKQNLVWSGKDNQDKSYPDGFYFLQLTTVDVRGNNIDKMFGPIQLTTSPKTVIVDVNNDVMSSLGDVFKFVQIKKPKQFYQSWKCQILNTNNLAVRGLEGQKLFKKVEWDGKNENGVLVPDGDYHAVFTFYYPNNITYQDSPINLRIKVGAASSSMNSMTKSTQMVSLNISDTNFSKEINKNIVLNLGFPIPKKQIEHWELVAEKDNGSIILLNETKPTSSLRWLGDDMNGNLLPDGYYKLKVVVFSVDHVRYESDYSSLLVDNTYPAINVSLSSLQFTPDADGNNDTITFSIKITEDIGLKEWTLTILKGKKSVKTWTGHEKDISLIWDGTDENGNRIVHSGDVYNVVCSAVDFADNIGQSEKQVFKVGILVTSAENGYRINIPSLSFKPDSAVLLPESFSILDDVIKILEKYPNYKVEIQGYTDDSGNYDNSVALSQQQVEAILKYMVNVKKMDAQRFSAKGYGPERPIVDNKDKNEKNLNNRIEFLLK